jgi:hypothetical protein
VIEHYTFADSVAGLARAFSTTLSLRRAGFKTRLATRRIAGFAIYTVIATPRKRATRKERGCSV